MTRFIARRLGAAVALLLILTGILFILQSISQEDGIRVKLGANATQEQVDAERDRLGLNDPLPVQYLHYVGNAVTGDLGESYRTRRPVTEDLRDFLPASAELIAVTFAFALALAAVFGLSGALRWPGGSAFRGLLLLGATAPPFLLGLGGIMLFYSRLDWLPANGRGPDDTGPTGFLVFDNLIRGDLADAQDALKHLLLPALVLSVAPALAIGRILRSSVEDVLRTDHVRTARSKGLTETRVVGRHVLRNAAGPALSMAGLQLGFVFAGVVVVEVVFSWPGIGDYLALSIPAADYPAILGVTLVLGAVYIVSNAVVDILQVIADPRIAT
ncbi:MAG: ABC transporter permease [Thermoleophilia bacterium]